MISSSFLFENGTTIATIDYYAILVLSDIQTELRMGVLANALTKQQSSRGGHWTMYSVTKRINLVSQPKGGYLPVRLFDELQFWDEQELLDVTSGVKAIQGMAVDYLTRYSLGQPKEVAFEISLLGAQAVSEAKEAHELLQNIVGLDSQSIFCACKLVGYDVAIRKSASFFTHIDSEAISKELIHNIYVMVNRSVSFFRRFGPVVKCGFTMKGGYNDIISCGDGDYITHDTLLDFKTSENVLTTKQTLQIAVYYVMGTHSIHKEFQNVRKLGVYNPLLNKAYFVDVASIPNSTFAEICRKVVGYNFKKVDDNWQASSGTNESIFKDCIRQYLINGFTPDKYEDGIHEISFDDYRSYLFTVLNLSRDRPTFSRTETIKMIKRSGFYMFVSVSPKNNLSVLHGGQLRKLSMPLQYYYDRLSEYGNTVLSSFSRYWDALYAVSDSIKSITPKPEDTKELLTAQYEHEQCFNRLLGKNTSSFDEWFEAKKPSFNGRVHGCIVDLDFYNHLFLNPFDGTLTPYHALSTEDKFIYRNIEALIAAERPEMLAGYKRKKLNISSSQITVKNSLIEQLPNYAIEKVQANENGYLCTDTYMYRLSGIFKLLQPIYDSHVITVWYDEILPPCKKNYDVEKSDAIIGQCAQMTCGMKAEVIADNGAKDITVRFEDGTIVEHTTRRRFKCKSVQNPNLKIQKVERTAQVPRVRKSYVGKTRKMNNGYIATIIEDFGCTDITVKFEDGLVRKHCRRDKFIEGKIAHKED